MSIFKKHVFVCVTGKSCSEQGSQEILDRLRREIAERGLKKEIRINKAGCFDQCGNGPMIVVYPDNVWYAQVKPSDCQEIVVSHLIGNRPVARLRYEGAGRS